MHECIRCAKLERNITDKVYIFGCYNFLFKITFYIFFERCGRNVGNLAGGGTGDGTQICANTGDRNFGRI